MAFAPPAHLTVQAPTSPSNRTGPLSPSNRPVLVPSVASIKILSPKEKRESLAAAEAHRARIDAERRARLASQKTQAIAKVTHEKKELAARNAAAIAKDKAQQHKEWAEERKKQQAAEEEAERAARAERERAKTKADLIASGIKLGLTVVPNTGVMRGLKIASVTRDSAAYLAAIEDGDIIREINGHVIATTDDFVRACAEFKPATAQEFQLWRDGTLFVTSVITKLAPASGAPAADSLDATVVASTPSPIAGGGSGSPTRPKVMTFSPRRPTSTSTARSSSRKSSASPRKSPSRAATAAATAAAAAASHPPVSQ